MSGRPRIVFMGTPAFAVPSLLACLEVGDVVAVVTQPDKPKGRGQSVSFSPVKMAALEKGLDVLQPEKLRTPPFAEVVRALAPDVCVVTAYGKLLPKDLLDAPSQGCLNVHASLLPRFRGAAPIQWAIASGDEKTGVCLMNMEVGLDTGPILACREYPIGPTDTSASLHDALSVLGGEIIRGELPKYLRGELVPNPQPSEGVVLAPMIQKEDGLIRFNQSAQVLERRMRAFTPWPGAYVHLQGQLLKIHRAQVGPGIGAPGTVLSVGPQGLEIACQSGSLLFLEVQPEGKRRMNVGEYLAGRKFEVGAKPFDP